MVDCDRVREQISAIRDGEDAADADMATADTHFRVCLACRAWLDDLDRLTARHRLSLVRNPDVTAAALEEWDHQAAADSQLPEAWRRFLAVAGTASILVSVPRLITGLGPWVWGPAHAHHVREIAAVEIALGLGFLLAAWRPARFSPGLLPVCAALVAMLGAVITFDVLAGNTAWVSELVHVPVVLGTLALGVVQRRCGRDPGPDAVRRRPGPPPDQELAA